MTILWPWTPDLYIFNEVYTQADPRALFLPPLQRAACFVVQEAVTRA